MDISRKKIQYQVIDELDSAGLPYDNESVEYITEKRLKKEIKDGIQSFSYQINTISGSNGQSPFLTLFIYLSDPDYGDDPQIKHDTALLAEEVFKQRIKGIKNEDGIWVSQTFPKLVYVLDEDNISKDSEYFWLTKLACQTISKRMAPDFVSAKVMKELKGDVYGPMGCRSFLTPDPIGHKYKGRFNQGVVTLNLPHIALSSGGDLEKFWNIFDERMKLIKKALITRHKTLKGTSPEVAPILWKHGALARMEEDTIDNLLYGNNSTISIGYAGLYETVKYMTGLSHTDNNAKEFAFAVLQFMNDKANLWKEETNLNFSVYGTPLESTTKKLSDSLKNDFGVVEGITDKDYVTNSFHVSPSEEIDAFSKLSLESQFQELSPGGVISYVELPNMDGNLEAMIALAQYIYNNIMYAELNLRLDVCHECGFTGEMDMIKDENNKRIWQCPSCKNTEQDNMTVIRRVCGYLGNISKNGANQGRLADIEARVLHLK